MAGSAWRRSVAVLSLTLLCAATGKSTESAQRKNIDRFYRVVCAETGTVRAFFETFGWDNEGELVAPFYALFPDKYIESLSDADTNMLNERLLHPDSHRSEFLACMRRVWPEVFCAKDKRIVEGPRLVKGFVEFRVSSGRHQVAFKFATGLSTIEDIQFSDDTTVAGELAKCARR